MDHKIRYRPTYNSSSVIYKKHTRVQSNVTGVFKGNLQI